MRDINQEDAMMAAIAGRVKTGTPLMEWPDAERAALLGALSTPENAAEQRKAAILRQHLFARRDVNVPDGNPQSVMAERVRADLTGLVPYASGLRIIPSS